MVFLPSKSVILDDEILTNEWKTYYGMIRDYIAQMVGGDKAESITITEGNITPSKAFVLVDSENELEVDDIERIDVTNFVDGNWICLTMANKDHAIVLKNGGDGDGAVYTYTETDEKLDYGEVVVLRLDGNVWRQVDISGYMRASADDLQTMTSTKKVATLAQLQPYIDNKSLAAVGLLAWAVRKPEGFVPCDNTQEYPASNFPVVKKMLDSGLLPSVTYDEYNSSVTSTGLCEKFGYSADSGKFYVPYLKAQVIQGTTYYPYICLYNSVTAQSLIDQQAILDEGMTLYNQMKAEFESFKTYVEQQMTAITTAVEGAVATVNTTRDEAVSTVNQTSSSAVNAVNNAATTAVQQVEDAYADFNTLYNEKTQGLITTANNQIVNINNASEENINKSRIWATGEDAEVETLEAGEHSSRGYADLSMAIANTPEDTPIDASTLVALDVIRGPRGYTGEKGAGLPTGGTAGQAVIKKSNADYDYEWANIQVDTSDCVKLAGAQTIAGVKTFTDNIIAPNQIDYTNITNCITEIPQDIKLELNNGTLTLKAGSKVYVPNGFESDGTTPKFDVVVIKTDTTVITAASTGNFMVLYGNGAFRNQSILTCYSGATAPTVSEKYAGWYDTTNNIIKLTNDTGATWVTSSWSFPICLIKTTGETLDSVDQVFNGFSYIGSTVFALPGVKGLIPNGRNEDGSLKNVEFTVDKVITRTITWNNAAGQELFIGKYILNGDLHFISTGKIGQYYKQDAEPAKVRYAIWYKPSENKVYRCDLDSNGNLIWKDNFPCYIGQWFTSATSPYPITELTTKLPFRAVDYNDFKDVIDATGGGLEIGDIGFAPLGIDETQNRRRYLNGQVISQSQFATFTDKVKAAIALYPNLSATEANWQAEVTNSKLGQCGKFVIDDSAGTIRLPCVVNINGLVDLANCGVVKSESLPNITGTTACNTYEQNNTTTGAFYSTHRASGAYSAPNNTIGCADFDASRSSSTYQDNAPVQQEAVQYPYFIQVATGVEESVDVTREIELNNPFSLFESKYSADTIVNASWLISNGTFHSGATYVTAYQALVVENNAEVAVGATVTLPNGSSYTKRGLSVKLSTDTYTDYDFVLNTTDSTFRLPLLNGDEDLVSNKYINLTLPESNSNYTAPANGWLVLNKTAKAVNQEIRLRNTTNGLRGYAISSSNNAAISANIVCRKGDVINVFYSVTGGLEDYRFIYSQGNGTLYFYIGETVQDANVINAAGVLTRVADLSDSYISGLGMPSNRYINLTLGASGSTYTAPANGWLFLDKEASASGQHIEFIISNDNGILYYKYVYATDKQTIQLLMPLEKGRICTLNYTATGETYTFRFIYAEGEY